MNLSPNISPAIALPVSHLFHNVSAVAEWLTLPHASHILEENRQRARLLAAILLVAIVAATMLLIRAVSVAGDLSDDPEITGGALSVLIALFLYVINRRGKTSTAAAGFIALTFILFVFVPFLPGSADNFLAYATVPILLTGIFFARRFVVFLTLAILVLVLILNSFDYSSNIRNISDYLIFSSVLIITFIYHLQSRETIRRQRLEFTNAQLSRSEEALQKLNLELEARVEARTNDLAVKNAELERSDRVKSQFLASMSHELRTPLNAILNFTEFVTMGMLGPVTDRQKDALDKSLESGRHLLSLINDVLDITKIEAGMMRLFVEKNIDLNEIVDSAQATAQTLLKGKSIQFTCEVDAPLPSITADRRRIRQILLNLISNACKFTEAGKIILRVYNEGSTLLFAVTDSGPGIKLEDHDRIFEPFQQTETGIHHINGTGLGLPISRRLVEAHEGELWVESDLGQGATFLFRIPQHPESLIQLLNGVEGHS